MRNRDQVDNRQTTALALGSDREHLHRSHQVIYRTANWYIKREMLSLVWGDR